MGLYLFLCNQFDVIQLADKYVIGKIMNCFTMFIISNKGPLSFLSLTLSFVCRMQGLNRKFFSKHKIHELFFCDQTHEMHTNLTSTLTQQQNQSTNNK